MLSIYAVALSSKTDVLIISRKSDFFIMNSTKDFKKILEKHGGCKNLKYQNMRKGGLLKYAQYEILCSKLPFHYPHTIRDFTVRLIHEAMLNQRFKIKFFSLENSLHNFC